MLAVGVLMDTFMLMKRVGVSVYNVIITSFYSQYHAIDTIRVAYKYIITCDCVFILTNILELIFIMATLELQSYLSDVQCYKYIIAKH